MQTTAIALASCLAWLAPTPDAPDSNPTPAPAAEPVSPPPPPFDPTLPPGGYWGPGEGHERAPREGDDEVLVGALLAPLGFIQTVSSAVMLVLFEPDRCSTRGALGQDLERDACNSLFILNAIRTAYGAATLVTGVALLGVGLHRRARHREWKRRHFESALRFGPTGVGHGAALTFTLRF